MTSRRGLWSLALALTANALSVTNVFPYAPFQVKFYDLTDDDRELGFYAGFFMTAYMVGAGLSAIPWGSWSDRHGKKNVIIIGLLANTFPQVVFGLSTTMALALSMRFVMGLLNGLVGAAKALAPELVPPNEQAAAMSMIAATWGVGNLLGPAIGGLLSQTSCLASEELPPSARCPVYPFFIPNLVCALLSAAGLVAVKCLMPDDKPRPAPLRVASDAMPPAEHPSPAAGEADNVTLRVGERSDASAEEGDSAAHMSPRQLWRRSAMLVAFYGLIALNDITHNEVFVLALPTQGLGRAKPPPLPSRLPSQAASPASCSFAHWSLLR